MAEFIQKRLQVFVSSTFVDLREERQAAVEAILVAGHIPAGMELFSAGDESQMEVIRRWIDESDVYLLILGGRYGSIEPSSGKSYIHLEYEYALKRNKLVFSLVLKDEAIEGRVKLRGTQAVEMENPAKLREFSALVRRKVVRFWEDYKDIKIAIGETLSNLARRDDLVGWVRPSRQLDVPLLANQLARLSNENSQLRMYRTGSTSSPEFEDLLVGQVDRLLKKRNLTAFISSNGEALGSDGGLFIENADIVDELIGAGIIELAPGTVGKFKLTRYGQLTLARIEEMRPTPPSDDAT